MTGFLSVTAVSSKGGPFAVQVCGILNGMGVQSRLLCMGDKPKGPDADTVLPAYEDHVGFLDKHSATEGAKWRELHRTAHFMCVPAVGCAGSGSTAERRASP